MAVDRDVVPAQMEGGLASASQLEGGRVNEKTFDGYRCLRMHEMPRVEVHIVTSSERLRPTGVGEPVVPPIAPAVANAIYAATGKRIRRLPIGDQLKA